MWPSTQIADGSIGRKWLFVTILGTGDLGAECSDLFRQKGSGEGRKVQKKKSETGLGKLFQKGW